MSPEDLKALEDRITTYAANAPGLIAALLYRQLNRVRGFRIDGIDDQIRRLAAKADISVNCSCSGRHSTATPYSHWLAGDTE